MKMFNRGKTYKIATGFVVLCFIMSALPLPIGSQEEANILTDHIVPEYITANEPLVSAERSDKVIIGAVLLGLVKSDDAVVSEKANYLTNQSETAIGVYFEGSFSVPMSIDGESSLILFTPCFMSREGGEKNSIYYAALTTGGGDTKVTVFSEEELKNQAGKIESQLKLTKGLFDKFMLEAKDEFRERDSFYVLHISDDAVKLGMKFLDEVRCNALRKKIKEMAKRNQLKVVAEPAYSPNSIIINSGETRVKERAWAILSQLFVSEGFNTSDILGILQAFNLFWQNGAEFDIDESAMIKGVEFLIRLAIHFMEI
jgi:hypothetical protein